MPPKKNANATAEGGHGTPTGAVAALCHMIMNCDDFKVDNNKLAPVLGVSHGKNVPRKLNSIVGPYGFEYKGGKITQSGSQAPDATVGASNDTSGAENDKNDKTAKAPIGLKSNIKARQGPVSKKRKLAVDSADEDSSDAVKEEDDREA